MNNVPQGQNFRPRRNNNNNYKKGGSSGRQDFRRGPNTNAGHSFNTNQSGGNRHPDLDIVIDSRAAQRASTMRDKYQSTARDAQTGGDRVYGEYCLQHVEHYNRILNAYNESRPQPVRQVETNEHTDNTQNTETGETANAPQQAAQIAALPPVAEEPYQAAGNN